MTLDDEVQYIWTCAMGPLVILTNFLTPFLQDAQ